MILPVIPMGAPRLTRADAWKGRPVVVRYHAFRDDVRWHFSLHRATMPTLPERLWVRFTFPMPKSWPRKKQEALRYKPHKHKPDIDNIQKALLDALCEEDSYVHTIYSEKIWGETGSIEIKELPIYETNS